jgi:hypothetical protein
MMVMQAVKAVKQTLVDKKQEGWTEGTATVRKGKWELLKKVSTLTTATIYISTVSKSFRTNYRYY